MDLDAKSRIEKQVAARVMKNDSGSEESTGKKLD
jgi:hypothetical protein